MANLNSGMANLSLRTPVSSNVMPPHPSSFAPPFNVNKQQPPNRPSQPGDTAMQNYSAPMGYSNNENATFHQYRHNNPNSMPPSSVQQFNSNQNQVNPLAGEATGNNSVHNGYNYNSYNGGAANNSESSHAYSQQNSSQERFMNNYSNGAPDSASHTYNVQESEVKSHAKQPQQRDNNITPSTFAPPSNSNNTYPPTSMNEQQKNISHMQSPQSSNNTQPPSDVSTATYSQPQLRTPQLNYNQTPSSVTQTGHSQQPSTKQPSNYGYTSSNSGAPGYQQPMTSIPNATGTPSGPQISAPPPRMNQPFNPYQQMNQTRPPNFQSNTRPPSEQIPTSKYPPMLNSGTMPPPPGQPNTAPATGAPPSGFPPMPPTAGNTNSSSAFPPQPPFHSQPSNMSPPGQMPPMNSAEHMHHSPPGPPQPSRNRLDPDLMPSPILVLSEDQKNRGDEPFQTGNRLQPAGVPPLCTTEFVSVDQGNCRPQYMRSTLYSIPISKDMCNNSRLPICLALQPFAPIGNQESPIPLADCSSTRIPIRCNRCKAYMSPLMVFIDGGRKFECLLCGCVNDVPEAYFCHLDHTGLRMDTYHRPELCVGSYEFLAPVEYCKQEKAPKEPAYIFMIDVSAQAIRSGMVHLLCNKLKHVLEMLPKSSATSANGTIGTEEAVSPLRVGFATYSHVVHFYNLSKSQSKPQMQVVADTSDIFLPCLDGFLVPFNQETKEIIEKVLNQIPQIFYNNLEIDPVLGPVFQAGLDALKADGRAGKLFVFHTAMPTREAPGKLKPRDNHKLLGTDKEKTILKPQTDFYTKLGIECVRAGCSVELFLFPNAHVDIATLAEVPKLTGGQIHLYNNFQTQADGDMLMSDLANCVQREYAFDAMVRVRTSAGIRPCDFFGNFYMETAQDVELGAMDPHKCILVELKHDDKLDENAGAHVQVALLYTSLSGERRLRIHNMSFSCCTQLSDLYKSVETDVLINWISKEASRALLKDNPKQVKEKIVDICANSLACYRKNCANPSSAGQLILPESMKLLPVYTNNVLKSQALSGVSDVTVDNRAYLMHTLNSMTVSASCAYFYPRLIPVHTLEFESSQDESNSGADVVIPSPVRCSADKLDDKGCYILENGLLMVLWVGQSASPNWMHQVFGVDSANQLDTEGLGRFRIPTSESPLNEKLRSVISKIRAQRKKFLKLYVVKQRDKLDMWFRSMLLEDKGVDNSPSYVDFLCHMHKEIRNLLN